ncbi:iron-containing alcohol dehydrogenase [Herbiconiux sp. KACC 21604]|uniref:iron-containing alcohol dehydrogenase n=1 Tax=unclassified Herbiconiux TaxID=2618217 RepID=UPI0020A32FBB|nr:iron-containing alcohol dehydrogenase [Herbiconiux sp. SALV-R1]WPO85629.1 iron-containing alcohol dehydrogenase [Herbiconiux sp. KACC 21604]
MPEREGAPSALPPTGTLRLPSRIHVGFGVREQIPELLAEHGSRVFAVVDPFLADSPEFVRLVERARAAGLTVTVHSEVSPELPVDSLTASGAAAARVEPDVVLAYGGGSSLDAAKLIALLVSHGGSLADYYGENRVPGPVLPVVAVPTTAGTGSEVTPVAVVSDPHREMKLGISSPHLVPAAAVVDPELTLGAPASVTAYAGIDALVHALESYTAAPLPLDWNGVLPVFTGSNLFADQLALEAVRRIAPYLGRAVADGSDREAREQVAYGSLLAGMSFGPTGTHLSHALQYPIGALTKTPHGLGTGLMIPYVLQACVPAVPERLAALDLALGGRDDDTWVAAQDAVDRVAELCRSIGIPASLAEIGITRDQLPRIAELALGSARLLAISPIGAEPSTLLTILEAAHAGDRSLIAASARPGR